MIKLFPMGRTNRLILLLITLSSVSIGIFAAEVTIRDYEFKEYNRYPRMEEEDRLRGRTFTFRPGLEIIADVDEVEVRFFEEVVGWTPFEVDDIARRAYRVRMERSGYEIVEFWVTVRQDYRTVVLVEMGPPMGQLEIVGVPPGARITVDRDPYTGGVIDVPAGPRSVLVTAFGYNPVRRSIRIEPGVKSIWEYDGSVIPFAVGGLTVSPRIIEPGDLRGSRIRFTATGPGIGVLKITDSEDQLVFEESYPALGPQEEILWRGLSEGDTGSELPYGEYRLLVEGVGADGASSAAETTLRVDGTIRRAARSMATGLPGLLYTPATDIITPGRYQLGTGAGAYIENGTANFAVPAWIGARGSPALRWEIGGHFGISARDPFDTTSIGFGVYGAWRMTPSAGPFRANLTLSFAYRGYAFDFGLVPLDDPTPEVPGLALGVPMQLVLGRWGIVLTPQATLTFLEKDGNFWRFSTPARVVGTLGFGVYNEGPRYLVGFSGAVRTPSAPAGPLDWGFWSGIEGRLDLPGDAAYLSVMVGARALPSPATFLAALGFGITG